MKCGVASVQGTGSRTEKQPTLESRLLEVYCMHDHIQMVLIHVDPRV